MKTIEFPDGVSVPGLGQGTWHMGMDRAAAKNEADALRYGLDQGLSLIDTAEMYHDAELVVADAIAACEKSLKRLGIECLDLYLLHWSGSYPMGETLEAFDQLVSDGKILRYGVSNFDTRELSEGLALPFGEKIATNQVLYNLHHRGIEWDLLPQCLEQRIPVMAYSPLNQGHLAPEVLNQIGMRHNVSAFQIALAWVLQQDNVMAIPKASDTDHIDRNLIAADIELTYEEIKQLDTAFPPPRNATPLEMI